MINETKIDHDEIKTEDKYKHLCMIEEIIERMAKNSFTLKGWALTLVVLIGSFSAYGSNQKYIVVAFLPIACFWLLDTYYLQKEREYRTLYNEVRCKKETEIDFNLDYKEACVKVKDTGKFCYFNCMFSFTEGVFYIPITVGVILLIGLLHISV